MFMVKDEFENTKRLFKVKLKNNLRGYKTFIFLAVLVHLMTLASPIKFILTNRELDVESYFISDYSITFFFGLLIAFVSLAIVYRNENDYLIMLPQTNNSRFISSQLLNHLHVIVVGVTLLVLYFINYFILNLFIQQKENYFFGLDFDIRFVIIGFITFTIYGFVFAALFGLIGALFRKWPQYTLIAILLIFCLFIYNSELVINKIPDILKFIIVDSSFGLFILKSFVIWLIITAISIIVNHFTIYHKSNRITPVAGVVIICVILVGSLSIPALLLFRAVDIVGSSTELVVQTEGDHFSDFTDIQIDVSHLPRGSKLKLAGKNIYFPEIDSTETITMEQAGYVYGTEFLESLDTDTLTISYRLPTYKENGSSLYDFANPRINAYLIDDTLHIDYDYDNAYVLFLPIWRIAGQFSEFVDKGVMLETVFGYSRGGTVSTYIHIR